MRIAILGNSGSGKSTLARELAGSTPILDLDTIVWEPGQIAVERPRGSAIADLDRFCASDDWIVEGCYGDLVAHALALSPELVFANPGEEACLRNCRARPWEPHKYATKEAQDEKLPFLLAWVSDYYRRDGVMSYANHRALFDAYRGPKREIKTVYELDGRRLTSLDTFFDEITTVLQLADWGHNLDAFNDILRGGFGTPAIGFTLRIAHSDFARRLLGHDATLVWLDRKVARCHPSNVDHVLSEIAAARRREGPTIFDILVEIIRVHGAGGAEASDNVDLVLG